MASRPERAFRIADSRHPLFDGLGAFLNGGRWNSRGRRIIYAAESYTGAMLEALARTRTGKVPNTHVWMSIAIPSDVKIQEITAEDVPGWDEKDSPVAKRFGDGWYDTRRSLILLVPSVVASGMARNVLINQDHPEFPKLQATEPKPVVWDERLFRRDIVQK